MACFDANFGTSTVCTRNPRGSFRGVTVRVLCQPRKWATLEPSEAVDSFTEHRENSEITAPVHPNAKPAPKSSHATPRRFGPCDSVARAFLAPSAAERDSVVAGSGGGEPQSHMSHEDRGLAGKAPRTMLDQAGGIRPRARALFFSDVERDVHETCARARG